MSPKAAPKAAKPAAKAKAAAPKESAKDAKKAKGAKAAAKASDEQLEAAPQVSADEQEEMEEQAEEAAAKSGGGNDAALAAAASTTEMSASFKNFRHHPDMENFYRFIYENDLRHEALAIIDEMAVQKLTKKTPAKNGKSASH